MSAQWRVLAEHADFRRLFGGTTASLLGSSMTTVALPLTAVTLLGASAAQMGLLTAAALVPNLVLALPAGVWLGRLPLRRVLVAVDLAQAALLGAVPVLALTGVLQLWHLYAVVLLSGACGLLDAVASESLLPQLVPRSGLLAANSARAVSSAATTTGGAALAGALVQALSAPVVIAVDALSFLVSALWRARITTPGRVPDAGGGRRDGVLAQVRAGFRVVFAHPAIRSVTVAATVGALAGQVVAVVLVLHLVRGLHLAESVVGLVVASAGLAGVLGALAAPRVTARLGHGPTFCLGVLLTGLAGLVLAAATGPLPAVLAVLAVGQVLRGAGPSLFGVTQQTLRQTLVPDALLSRALATWRVLVYGAQPVGALLGGVLGEVVGLRGTLVAGSALGLVAAATAAAGPLRRLRTLPEPPGECVTQDPD